MVSETRVVRVLAGDGYWPWIRQLPNNEPVWGDCEFVFGVDGTSKSGRADDWIVVFEEVPSAWTRPHDPNRTIFFCGEPPSIKKYGKRFLRQFGTIVTTDANSGHPNAIVSQTALPWHVGVDMTSDRTRPTLSYNDFLASPQKTKLCSVITSNKAMTREHARRLKFVEALKSNFGTYVDFYGRGSNEISDKDDALREYRFHIALENSSIDHYWTEKLSDPILRGCYPIYYGAGNLSDYFPRESFISIDIKDIDGSMLSIDSALTSGVDTLSAEAMSQSRRLVMSRYNIFSAVCSIVDASNASPLSPQKIRGENLRERAMAHLRRKLKRYYLL